MNCETTEIGLRAYLDGELAPAEEREVRSHLESCAACRDAYEQLAATVSLLHELPSDEPPPHFTASLQVRLAGLRAARGTEDGGRGTGDRRRETGDGGRRDAGLDTLDGTRIAARRRFTTARIVRYAAMAVMVVAGVVALFGLAEPRISAAELVGKVQQSWARLENYQCTSVSEGVVAGVPRSFEQRQWFQKPNLFRLETREHYPQVTYLEPDRVSIFMPGADWQGHPVAIVRARKP